MESDDDWGDAEKFRTAQSGWDGSASGVPFDSNNSSLEQEQTFLMQEGREPTNDEILEYMEKHRLQVFLTDILMHVARHFPPDPFEFLLTHIDAMVMKYRASRGKTLAADTKLGSKLVSPVASEPVQNIDPKKRNSIVKHIATVLQHNSVSDASAGKLFTQFAADGERLREEEFGKVMEHLQAAWGLQAADTRLMLEKLKRWRFRANVAKGTRGLPLWPLPKSDFVEAYPGLLRSVRDRYVPIGAQLNRSMFIKQAAGALLDTYTMGSKLGRGAYGEVSLVTLTATKERRVCKRVEKAQCKVSHEDLLDEVELMRALDHPHIVRLYEYFETERQLDMIMEPVFGGTLTHLVSGLHLTEAGESLGKRPEALTETWVAKVFAQLLSALAYAHDVVGVVHKDLKCDNVLLVGAPKLPPEEALKEPVHAMLADFGIAEVFAALPMSASMTAGNDTEADPFSSMGTGTRPLNISRRSTRVGGTPSYMSPEMFKGSFNEKSDIWSLGVMLFQVMTGTLPYRGDNLLMQAHAVCNPRRHPPWDMLPEYKWSLGARWFCQQLLSKDEGMRPSAEEASRDAWLAKMSANHGDVAATPAERQALSHQHLQSFLTKVSMNAITSQLNLSQLHHMNLRFKSYDTSNDGRLSHIEMRQVLADVGITNAEDAEMLIESFDADNSGSIEYSEFMAGCLDVASDGVKDHLKVAFRIFDLDGSGSISKDELRQVLTQGANSTTTLSLARPSSPPLVPQGDVGGILPDGKTVDEVMSELDKDGKGGVTAQEFEAYILAEHEKAGKDLHAQAAN